jgi:hypothetical protein
MLTQELDRETEQYLADILAQEQMTSDELIRTLIRDRWLSLKQSAEVTPPLQGTAGIDTPSSVGMPASLSHSFPRPKNSKQLIADFVRRKNQRFV